MTIARPIVIWEEDYIDIEDGRLKQRPVPSNLWDLGTVDADNNPELTTKTFYIWNNKKPNDTSGYETVPDMTNCRITTKDGQFDDFIAGEMKSPLVKEQWIRVANLSSTSSGNPTYAPIGSEIKDGVLTQKDIKITAFGNPDAMPTLGTISGATNDGSYTTNATKNNYAKEVFQCKVPTSADPRTSKFIVRVYYNV